MHQKHRLTRALALAFGSAVIALAQPALAQSNATGTLYGQVQNAQGLTVLIENLATGLKRTLTPDADGRVQASALPVGLYRATLLRDGKVLQTLDQIEVRIGQGAELGFARQPGQLETVTVSGARRVLDVSSADSGATFSARQLAALPTARNIDGIIKLAPNTTSADPRYPAGASIGGGAASENSYYINGFPVTNPLNQLGASELPFGAIDQAQILSGGFGVEFGRSTGGVVNIITKTGTNRWEYGASASIAPASFRNAPVDRYYANTGKNPRTDGKLRLHRSDNTSSETVEGAYVGGPLIEDHLFMFVAAEHRLRKDEAINADNGNSANPGLAAVSGWNSDRRTTDRFLGKLDWNITDGHRLDLTLIGDTPKLKRVVSGFDTTTNQRTGVVTGEQNWQNDEDGLTSSGAQVKILRYVGELTNDLTLTALVGRSETRRKSSISGYDVSVPPISFENADTSKAPGVSYPVLNGNTDTLYGNNTHDTVRGLRLDLEYRLGRHTLHAGLDDNRMSSLNAGKIQPPGGRSIQYRKLTQEQADNHAMVLNDGGAQTFWLADPSHGALAAKGYYGVETVTGSISNAYSNQAAQYLEDRFQATKNLLLTAGLRRESYENRNQDNQTFLKIGQQLNPRASAIWDVNGDASLKTFASAGRYSIQIPTLVALRGANGSTLTNQIFSYSGVDAKGQPTGRVDLTKLYSTNNEYGQPKPAALVSQQDIKPAYQDELIIGIEKALLPEVSGGIKLTHRALKSTIDDMCDWRPFYRWLQRHPEVDGKAWHDAVAHLDTGSPPAALCASFNPGRGGQFYQDFKGDGKTFTRVDLTAQDLGFEKPKRTYTALDFSLEHPFRHGWYGKLTYTYSKLRGNTEGQTDSDLGQRDVSATVTWDHPELMEHASGYLANDRRHQLKGYGYWQPTSEWQLAGAFTYESGRPRSCLGLYAGPNADDVQYQSISYGSVYHYCQGKVSPRGTLGRLSDNLRMDLSLSYMPQWAKGLELSVEAFNIANSQRVTAVSERAETGSGAVRNTYELPVGNSEPRSMRFSVQYNKAF